MFTRNSRHVTLSKEGEFLIPYARRVIQECRNLESQLSDFQNSGKRTLRLGMLANLSSFNFIELLQDYNRQYPDYYLNISNDTPKNMLAKLKNGEYELAFLRQYGTDFTNGITCIPYAIDELFAVLPADHPLSQHKSLTLREISN